MTRKENAPMKGRGSCVADTHNSTANHPVSQSLPAQRAHLLRWLQEQGLYVLMTGKGGAA